MSASLTGHHSPTTPPTFHLHEVVHWTVDLKPKYQRGILCRRLQTFLQHIGPEEAAEASIPSKENHPVSPWLMKWAAQSPSVLPEVEAPLAANVRILDTGLKVEVGQAYQVRFTILPVHMPNIMVAHARLHLGCEVWHPAQEFVPSAQELEEPVELQWIAQSQAFRMHNFPKPGTTADRKEVVPAILDITALDAFKEKDLMCTLDPMRRPAFALRNEKGQCFDRRRAVKLLNKLATEPRIMNCPRVQADMLMMTDMCADYLTTAKLQRYTTEVVARLHAERRRQRVAALATTNLQTETVYTVSMHLVGSELLDLPRVMYDLGLAKKVADVRASSARMTMVVQGKITADDIENDSALFRSLMLDMMMNVEMVTTLLYAAVVAFLPDILYVLAMGGLGGSWGQPLIEWQQQQGMAKFVMATIMPTDSWSVMIVKVVAGAMRMMLAGVLGILITKPTRRTLQRYGLAEIDLYHEGLISLAGKLDALD
jgi:hypothetical protein